MKYCLQADCCAYLKKKCDFRYSHYESHIQTIYTDVLKFLLKEKKPIPRDRVDGKKSQQSQIKELTYIFDYFERIQVNSTTLFLCSKTYKSSKHSTHLMFRCQQCGIEEGSVSCVECFNLEDHMNKNHQFELIKVPGGCCDCGNYSKWQQEGTCKRHRVNGELEEQPDQIDSEIFQDKCNHFLSIFCRLYLAFKARQSQILQLQNQNNKNKAQLQKQKQGLKYIQNLVDIYGSYFINTLVSINNNHLVFNKITRKWMQQILRIPDFPQIQQTFIEKRCIMYMLMRFLQMKKTGRACSELYLILLNRSQQWTRNIAIQYFKISRLPRFFLSGFSKDFTPQILCSSKLIKELIDGNQIEPLIFNTQLGDNPSQQELDKFHAQHQIFIHNLGYLLEMKQTAFKAYWLKFTQRFGFEYLFTYYQIFNRSEFNLCLAHRKYFALEESALKRTIKIIDKMDGDKNFIVVNLRKLTHKLFKLYQLNQYKKFKDNNLFFTYERVWAVFLFAYFYCYKQKTSCNELSKAEIEELFNNIYSFQQAPKQNQSKLQSFMRVLQRLLQELIRRFFSISQVMKGNSNRGEHLKFAWSYFMQSNLLYSVDSFMLVMILQIGRAYNSKLDSGLKQLLDRYLAQIDIEFRTKIANKQQIKYPVVAMHTFMFLILEATYFKYQDLIILAHFKKLAMDDRYQQLFIDFYNIIHNAWYQKGRRDTLPQFKDSFQMLFFIEDYFFHQFVTQKQAQPIVFDGREQRIFNIQYFFALSHKIGKQGCSNKYNVQQSFKQIPKSLRRYLGVQILESSVHLSLVRQWLRELTEVGNIAKSMKSRVNQLVTQLYKVMIMTGSANYQIYFRHQFEKIRNIFDIVSGLIQQDVKEYNPSHILSIYRSLDCQSFNFRLHLQDSNFRQQFDQRLEYFRKLDSQTNRKEANLDRYNDQKCMLLKKCKHPQQQVVYQMCFINVTNLLGVFQIDKEDKYLCFSTCGHLVHKQCYENQRAEQQSNIFYCQRCHRVYNFIISPLQRQHSAELIGQDFNRISSFLKKHKVEKPVQLQIVKALMAFLLINITIDDFNQLRKNMQIYKNLFSKLKMWSQKQGDDLKQRQVKFNSKMHAQLTKLIWYSVASFGQNIGQVNNSKEYCYYKGQIDYIQYILSFFNQKSSKWQLRDPSAYFIQAETNINLEKFPSTLLQLNQNRKCILCKSGSKHSYYICLSHTSNQIEHSSYCVCFQDLKEWVTKHLTGYQTHMDECVMIRTDTGEIHLFHVDTNGDKRQIWERVQPSVYLDHRKNSYQVDKKYKLEDFTLDHYKIKKTINSLRSWNTVLKIIKIQ